MILSSPLCMTNSQVLELSQETNQYLRKYASSGASTIASPFLSITENLDLWAQFEQRFYSCLTSSDDQAAHLCLERLVDRFGAANERVMGLRGIYQEAVARDDDTLARILQEYDDILNVDPLNSPVAKRRIALLSCLSRPQDAIGALLQLLELSPTDIEAWAELAELYFSQDFFSQAVFCLEEVLLVTPNAWNIHARIGEILFASGSCKTGGDCASIFVEASRRFCRSIELCEDYLRGYFGLLLTTRRLLATVANKNKHENPIDELEILMPSIEDIESLNAIATSGLLRKTRESTHEVFNSAEGVAARAFLDGISQSVQR